MPIPTAITDLSATAASNYPAGTDAPNVIDDTLRAHASFIRQEYDGSNGIGYRPGNGGAVTQLTSKTTGVTLNKRTGQITMNNASLAAGATAEFIVTNSLCSTSDVVIACPAGNANYTTLVTGVANGEFRVRITNITGGDLGEAVAINYTVIGGALS